MITNLYIAFVSSSLLRGPRGLAVPLQDLPPVLPHRALYLEPLKLLIREPGVHEELVPGVQSIELLQRLTLSIDTNVSTSCLHLKSGLSACCVCNLWRQLLAGTAIRHPNF